MGYLTYNTGIIMSSILSALVAKNVGVVVVNSRYFRYVVDYRVQLPNIGVTTARPL